MNTETKMDVDSPPKGLRVLIVGAGIGGLAAAIALRQQGHEVEVRGLCGLFGRSFAFSSADRVITAV
jgi:monoamine oxidase